MINDEEKKGAAKEARRLRQLAQEETRRRREAEATQRRDDVTSAVAMAQAQIAARTRNLPQHPASPVGSVAPQTSIPRRSYPASGHPTARNTVIPQVNSAPAAREIPYRLSVKVISRGTGRSVVAAAAYRSGARLEDQHYGLVHDYSRKSGVICSEILLPDGAPEWLRDRATLWNNIESIERRGDAQLAREIQLSIPYELYENNEADAITLVRRFALGLTDHGMVVDWCLHRPHVGNDPRNVHAHLLITLRRIDVNSPHGFGKKAREWNDRAMIQKWRLDWERRCNRALANSGIDGRVSAKSYADRGIDKVAQPKLGPWLARKVQRVFRLIREGSLSAGEATLITLGREYERTENYLIATLHNMRINELNAIDMSLASTEKPQVGPPPLTPPSSEQPLPTDLVDLFTCYRKRMRYSANASKPPSTSPALVALENSHATRQTAPPDWEA